MEQKRAACRGAGASADGNLRHRAQMEDRHVVKELFAGSDEQAFFAVYDGRLTPARLPAPRFWADVWRSCSALSR